METFKLTKKIWTLFGLNSKKKSNFIDKVYEFAVNSIVLWFLSLAVVFSLTDFVKNLDNAMEKKIYAIFESIVGLSALLTYSSFIVQKESLLSLAEKIQKDVSKRATMSTAHIYEEAEKRTTTATRLPILICFSVYDVGYPILILCYWLIDQMRGEIDTSKWLNVYEFWWVSKFPGCFTTIQDLIISFRVPYDHTTVCGQFFHSFVQMCIASSYFVSSICNLTIFLGFIFYLDAFVNDFMNVFDNLDKLLNGKTFYFMNSQIILRDAFILERNIIE